MPLKEGFPTANNTAQKCCHCQEMKFHGEKKRKEKKRKKIRRESLCLGRASGSESSVPNWFFFETVQQFVYLGQHLFSKQTSTKFAQGKRAYIWSKEMTSREEDPGSLQCWVPLVLPESPKAASLKGLTQGKMDLQSQASHCNLLTGRCSCSSRKTSIYLT